MQDPCVLKTKEFWSLIETVTSCSTKEELERAPTHFSNLYVYFSGEHMAVREIIKTSNGQSILTHNLLTVPFADDEAGVCEDCAGEPCYKCDEPNALDNTFCTNCNTSL